MSNNYLHNPFQNRFNDPVTHRHDEGQAYANMVWLRERSLMDSNASGMATTIGNQTSQHGDSAASTPGGRTLAGYFSLLLILLVSVVALMRAF